MRKHILRVALAGVLLALGLIGASWVSRASAQPLTQTSQCTRAHPCTPDQCEELGAQGGDCYSTTTYETTSTPCDEEDGCETTTTPETTTVPPPHGCGVAGKDGEPGNDDCAVTTSTTTETTTTTPETTSTTTPTTTTTETTTTTTAGDVLGGSKEPKKPVQAGVLGESSATRGQLAFTP